MSTRQFPPAIRTFNSRRGRFSQRQDAALAQLYPVYGVNPAPGTRLDFVELFGRDAPVVLEIGSGMGETTAAMAAADPDRNYLAVEVHPPGISQLLWRIDELGLRNLRVCDADAIELVESAIAPNCLAAIHVFFPDPWPKVRHHKRRLIRPTHVALLRSRLTAGGTLHCATDWADYAQVMLDTLDGDPELVNSAEGFADRPAHRPVTKFEARGIKAGHSIFDLVFHRGATR